MLEEMYEDQGMTNFIISSFVLHDNCCDGGCSLSFKASETWVSGEEGSYKGP